MDGKDVDTTKGHQVKGADKTMATTDEQQLETETPSPPPIYTRNASERMLQGQISTKQVEDLLANPQDASITITANGAVVYTGTVDGRELTIVVREPDPKNLQNPRTVLTLWDANGAVPGMP